MEPLEPLQELVVEFINLVLATKLDNPREILTPHHWDPYQYLRGRGVDRDVAINRICKNSRLPYYPSMTPHPTTLSRTLVREYARHYSLKATTLYPWLPLTTIGTIPVLGHFYPKATDLGGFPSDMCFRVVVSYDFYMANLQACTRLLETTDSTLPPLPKPPSGLTKPSDVFHWLSMHHMVMEAQKFTSIPEDQLEERLLAMTDIAFGFYTIIKHLNTVPLWTMHIDRDLLNMIPEPLAQKYGALCYFRLKNVLYVAMTDPSTVRRFEEELNARSTDLMGNRNLIACYAPDFIIAATANQIRNQANIAIADAPQIEEADQQNVKINIDTAKIFAIKEISGKEDPETI